MFYNFYFLYVIKHVIILYVKGFYLNHRVKEKKRFVVLQSRSQATEDTEFPCGKHDAQLSMSSKCLGIHPLSLV